MMTFRCNKMRIKMGCNFARAISAIYTSKYVLLQFQDQSPLRAGDPAAPRKLRILIANMFRPMVLLELQFR